MLERKHTVASAAPDMPWGRIGSVTRLPGGGLIVPDHSIPVLYHLDSAGLNARTIGKSGEGPGEYLAPAWVGATDSTLWVWDIRLHRLTYYDLAGHHLRSAPYGSGSGAAVPLNGGGVLMLPTRGAEQDTAYVLRYRPAASTPDTLARIPARRRLVRLELPGGRVVTGVQDLDDGPLHVLFRDGSGWAVVSRSTEGPPELRVDAFAPTGALRWKRTFPVEARPVSVELLESVVAKWRSAGGSGGVASDSRIRRAIFVPARLPPASAAFGDQDGRLWIAGDLARHGFLVIGRSGEPEFRVETSAGMRFAGSSGDSVWFVETDDMEGDRLVEYQIR